MCQTHKRTNITKSTYDYVGEGISHAKFGSNLSTGGPYGKMREI